MNGLLCADVPLRTTYSHAFICKHLCLAVNLLIIHWLYKKNRKHRQITVEWLKHISMLPVMAAGSCKLYLNGCIPELSAEPKSFIDQFLLCWDNIHLRLSRAYLCTDGICLQDWENPLKANADPNTWHLSTFGIKHADEVIISTAGSHTAKWCAGVVIDFTTFIVPRNTINTSACHSAKLQFSTNSLH